MRQPNDDWTEFDWELTLREGDQFANRYFSLLSRFCDLPGSSELIARHMGPEFADQLRDCEFDCESCANRWECEFAMPVDWSSGDLGDYEEEGSTPEPETTEEEPGGVLFYENDPTFVMLRQAAIGWCNIYAAVLPSDARATGLRILFHVGRSLANLAYSIDNGLYEQPAASIAFAKRGLSHLNESLGLLNRLERDKPRLKKLFATIRSALMRSNEALLDHLDRCRRGSNAGKV